MEITGQNPKPKINVVIADDHAILRAGLRMLLDGQPDIRVIGEAENGDEALAMVREKRPDVLLLDLSMPGTGGVETTTEIRRRALKTRVLVLTMHGGSAYVEAALSAGASGYILKRSLDSELVSAIRSVHQGKAAIDSAVTRQLVERAIGKRGPHKLTARESFDLLSRREQQVLTLVAEGYTNEEIAGKVFISVKSVETYRSRLLKKLHIRTRRDIVQFAIKAGLLISPTTES